MKSKFLAWVSAVSAVALVSGVLVLSANAHIGASHSPFTTDGPDLRSASVTGDDTVDFCFDEEVADEGDIGDYDLGGYDEGQDLDATDVDLGSADECVEVTFDPVGDQDIRNYTIAMVADDSVEDRAGDTSVEGTVELDGSTAPGGGQTSTAPNLTGFDAQGNNQIAYSFDEPVDCTAASGIAVGNAGDAANFGFYDDDGAMFIANDVMDCDGNQVDVEFGGGVPPPDVDDAERAFVADEFGGSGDVCDPDAGDDGCLEEESEAEGNEIDDHPDLTDVERTDDNQWLFTFDEDLDDTSISSDSFYIVEEDGQEHQADAGTCDTDADNDVECTFDDPGIEDSADSELPYGAVDDCAVLSDATPTECSTAGDAEASETGETPGLTDGPDLETITKDAPGELVTFNYDEPIDDDFAAAAADFFIFDVDGDKSTGSDIDDQEGNSVTVEFDEDDITDAVGGGSETGANPDWLGDDSPQATVGTEAGSSAGGSSGTTTTTTTSTSTTTTTTTRTGTTRRIPTTLTIRPKFRGVVGSSNNGCQRGRLVTLKKKTRSGAKTVGTTTSKSDGTWSKRKRRAKGRFFAKAAKKVFTAGNGDRIVCLIDKSPTIRVRRK